MYISNVRAVEILVIQHRDRRQVIPELGWIYNFRNIILLVLVVLVRVVHNSISSLGNALDLLETKEASLHESLLSIRLNFIQYRHVTFHNGSDRFSFKIVPVDCGHSFL